MLPLRLHDTEVMLCDCCTSVTLHVTATNLSAKGLLVVKLTLKGNTVVSYRLGYWGVLIVTYGHSVYTRCMFCSCHRCQVISHEVCTSGRLKWRCPANTNDLAMPLHAATSYVASRSLVSSLQNFISTWCDSCQYNSTY